MQNNHGLSVTVAAIKANQIGRIPHCVDEG